MCKLLKSSKTRNAFPKRFAYLGTERLSVGKKVPVTEIRVEMTFGLATQFVSALFFPCAKKRKQTVFEFSVARGLKKLQK